MERLIAAIFFLNFGEKGALKGFRRNKVKYGARGPGLFTFPQFFFQGEEGLKKKFNC